MAGPNANNKIPNLVVKRALVEMRRLSLLFLDHRGQIGMDLIESYADAVSGYSTLSSVEDDSTLTSQWVVDKGPHRQGTIDARRATYEDSNVDEIEAFLSEAMPFLRRATTRLGSHPIERLGVLFQFAVSETFDRNGILQMHGVTSQDNRVMLDARLSFVDFGDPWSSKVRCGFEGFSPNEHSEHASLVISIDQSTVDVSYRDVLAINLTDRYEVARTSAQAVLAEIIERGKVHGR